MQKIKFKNKSLAYTLAKSAGSRLEALLDKGNDKSLEVAREQCEVLRLEKEHAFMLQMLVDIEERIDHCKVESNNIDLQQISVGIKRLRGLIGSEHFLQGNYKPGLEREM
jgi:hypothetical protein